MEITYRDELSRGYLNHVTVAALIVLYNLIDGYFSVADDVESMNQLINDACFNIQTRLDQSTEMINVIADTFVQNLTLFADSIVGKVINMVADTIDLAGEIVAYLIDTYRSVLQCFVNALLNTITFVVQQYGEDIQNALQSAVNNVTSTADTIVNGLTSFANSVANVFSFFGLGTSNPVPNINIPSIPLPFNLTQLTESIPVNIEQTFTDDFVNLILQPFNQASSALRNEIITIDLAISNTTLQFVNITSPDICSKLNLTKEMELTQEVLQTTIIVMMSLAVVVMIAFSCFNIWVASKKERIMKGIVDDIQFGMAEGDKSKRQIVYELCNPISTTIATNMARVSGRSGKGGDRESTGKRGKLKWFMQYILYEPSIICFVVGMSSILIACGQISAVNSVEKQISTSLTSVVNAVTIDQIFPFANETSAAIDRFINSTNQDILTTQDTINSNFFGPISTFISNANSSVNAFLNTTELFLDQTLHLDVFGPFVDSLFGCVVEKRVTKFFDILDIFDILEITLPQFPANYMKQKMEAYNADTSALISDFVQRLLQVTQKIKNRAFRQLYIGIFITCFSLLIIIQGLVKLALLSSNSSFYF